MHYNFRISQWIIFISCLFILIHGIGCTSDEDNFDVIPPAGFAELNITIRQWTSSTETEARAGAVVRLYNSASDRDDNQNHTHENNTDTLGNSIFIDVPKSQTIFIRSTLLDTHTVLEEMELNELDIQNLTLTHSE